MDLILSTRNQSKANQIKPIFEGLSLRVLTLDEAGIEGEAVEDGTTLGENALKKALYAWERARTWCMSDDTGLYIDALEGRPGIHAARWAGDVPTEAIMRYTLEKLRHVPLGKRTATFKTAAVVVDPHGDHYTFVGEAPGIILPMPRVQFQPKMPYSGIFQPHGSAKVWAEMSVDEENAVSHRGKAFAQVREFFAHKSLV
jgi:XTP/dITP diphosphohydrolase